MTVGTALAGAGLPRTDARILLSFVTGESREALIAHDDRALTANELERFDRACAQRIEGMPVAYITGTAWFYGREFLVDERVLIPRPETELLVEEAIAYLRARASRRVFEAGAGSGAIACTIAAEVRDAMVCATDVSEEALAVADGNARRLGVAQRCRFVRADVAAKGGGTYDAVVANLPYIPSAELPRKPDPVGYEPRVALDGGPDGLTQYRSLLLDVPRLLRSGGLLLMEAAPPTVDPLCDLALAALPGAKAAIRDDYAGLGRYVSLTAA